MSDTTPQHDGGDGSSRSQIEVAAEYELPPSQPSDAEDSPIHAQLTAPMGSYKMTYVPCQVGGDDDSYSESDANDGRKGEGSDDGDGGDDEKSVHLSNYASDEAVSYVESCESYERYTDSSDEEESDEDNAQCPGGICRRRQSNSDSDTDDESDEVNEKVCNATSKESNHETANSTADGNASLKRNNLTEVTKKKSSEKIVGIWDDDGTNRRRSSNPVRKLWSDYVHKSDANHSRGQLRAGARFTNSFTDRRQPEPMDHSWDMSQCNRFPPQLGLGLGRGLVPNNNRHYDPNRMRPPGPPRNWQQQRRPNNPHCHYQQQQQYFEMPRGSYASVVQKGAVNQGRTDSRNTNQTKPPSHNSHGNDNRFPQQSHNRQQQQQRPLGPGPQMQQQSYNRGTVTAAQILQQQRMQQSQRQQPHGHQRVQQNEQQTPQGPNNQGNRQSWQPPKGPHVRPMMIGTQQVYLIQPSWNRRPVAEEDPAIVRAEPHVPPPYVILPGGIPLALPTTMRAGNAFGYPAGQTKIGGSGGMPGAGVNQQTTAVN